jgi:hypothetical protein
MTATRQMVQGAPPPARAIVNPSGKAIYDPRRLFLLDGALCMHAIIHTHTHNETAVRSITEIVPLVLHGVIAKYGFPRCWARALARSVMGKPEGLSSIMIRALATLSYYINKSCG